MARAAGDDDPPTFARDPALGQGPDDGRQEDVLLGLDPAVERARVVVVEASAPRAAR